MNWGAFFIGVFVGSALALGLVFLTLYAGDKFRARLRNYVDLRDGIEFRKMPNPPDEGIDQLLYKPQGEPATVTKNAVRRRGAR